jgi:hypothetical protein
VTLVHSEVWEPRGCWCTSQSWPESLELWYQSLDRRRVYSSRLGLGAGGERMNMREYSPSSVFCSVWCHLDRCALSLLTQISSGNVPYTHPGEMLYTCLHLKLSSHVVLGICHFLSVICLVGVHLLIEFLSDTFHFWEDTRVSLFHYLLLSHFSSSVQLMACQLLLTLFSSFHLSQLFPYFCSMQVWFALHISVS